MKKLGIKNLNIGIVILILIITSCIPQKRMIYLQDKNPEDTLTKFFREKVQEYKIQPGDNLYIKVHSLDDKTFSFFNTIGTQSLGSQYSDISVYLNSYVVNDLGCIDFPIVGEIEVQKLTIGETKDLIQEIINKYLIETTITVKVVNYKITIIGEVNNPGEYSIYQDNINIFEAISLSGDLTDFANRNEVSLVRRTKNGAVIHHIDLTDNLILESEYYYLMPNDILYIKPLKGKQFAFANFPYGLVFSAISTTLLLINYFK
jgi:polysaccharide biosynthesis/export protein